jgi:hypothetical protein
MLPFSMVEVLVALFHLIAGEELQVHLKLLWVLFSIELLAEVKTA